MFASMIKGVIGVGTAIGVGKIVNNIVIATQPLNESLFSRVVTKMGAYGLGLVAGDYVGAAVERQVGSFFKVFGLVKESVGEIKAAKDATDHPEEPDIETYTKNLKKRAEKMKTALNGEEKQPEEPDDVKSD